MLAERLAVAAERVLDDGSGEAEDRALPGRLEDQLAVAARLAEIGQVSAGHNRATPIIESLVTRAASSASVMPSVPAGRSGRTR